MKIYMTFLMCLLLASCSHGVDYRIGVSQCSDDDWRSALNAELRREAMFHENMEIEVRSADDDSKRQIDDIRHFIDEGVDLLIVAPNVASDIRPAVDEAYDRGIPVILIDRKTDSKKYTAFVGADNVKIGNTVAEYIIAMRKGKPTNIVEITGLKGSTPAEERHKGFKKVISRDRSMNVLCSAGSTWRMGDAEKLTDSLLTRFPKIDVIFAHNDRMADGVRRAIEKTGREQHISVIGVDALMTKGGGVDNVLKGRFVASCLYPTGGTEAIAIAANILDGTKHPKEVDLPIAIIDNKNARVLKLQYQAVADQDHRLNMLGQKIDRQLREVSRQKWMLYSALAILVLCAGMAFSIYRQYKDKSRIARLLEQRKQELERHNSELVTMSRELETATHAKLVFFTNVSHDFRTPLTLILDPIDQLLEDCKEGLLTMRQSNLLNVARENARILLRLINQILDFRKIENHQARAKYAMADVPELIRRWTAQFAPSMDKRRINMVYDCKWQLADGSLIPTDVDKLEAIIYNMVGNAEKFTPAGGSIKIGLTGGESSFTVRVSDTGIGIDKEKLPRIFDRFYQTGGHVQGTGVGLALAKSYVEILGGSIMVESEQGHGTSFTVNIPIPSSECDVEKVPPHDMTENAGTQQTCKTDNDNEQKPTALVIDDNEHLRDYVAGLLRPSYNVLTAENGLEGLEVAVREIPDIIVSDILMPEMSGIELCKQVKTCEATSHIPVILLTACTLDEERIQGFDNGADSYISKPFDRHVLLSRVGNLIKNRKQLRQLYVKGNIDTTTLPKHESEFLRTLQEHIEKRMGDSELSVNDLASDMHLSRVQLYRKVKALTDKNVSDLIRISRLERAHFLLTTTEKTVGEIGYEVGFSAPSYFTKCYKEYFGCSPSSKRQNQQ